MQGGSDNNFIHAGIWHLFFVMGRRGSIDWWQVQRADMSVHCHRVPLNKYRFSLLG